ncbi:MAG: DUF2189 domain-containing protein [Alphaproteobacteria bacterium]|nr:DUF2189 domain-containing protein [Alphaproteobacteria bacterium]
MTIRNPVEWGVDQFRLAGIAIGAAGHAVGETGGADLAIRRITAADLRDALRKGFDDFGACRSDVLFLCIIYPVAGLLLARLAFGYDMVPLLFPLASGFALIGPLAGLGLYEMSRRREQGVHSSLPDAFSVVRSPSFGAIAALGLLLLAIFVVWLGVAQAIYDATLGPKPPESIAAFVHAVLTTQAGWTMIGLGMGVGFLFALLALTISVVSFPLLLDRVVPLRAAIGTSVRAVIANPGPMALWGLIVACGLAIGSIPALLGLIVVMPVLGHATWHLYRRVVAR